MRIFIILALASGLAIALGSIAIIAGELLPAAPSAHKSSPKSRSRGVR